MTDSARYQQISQQLQLNGVCLVAVSKTKSVEEIMTLYDLGQRDFGENYVQELLTKQPVLPADIRWHFIGHLQTNKVKLIAAHTFLIQSVDSLKLFREIDKQGKKINRQIDCLLQMHIASEETKFGLDESELEQLLHSIRQVPATHTRLRGFMGMASFVQDQSVVLQEFSRLKTISEKYGTLMTGADDHIILSMGMSADYRLALEQGSNMVRIGSLIFGERPAKQDEGEASSSNSIH